MMVKEPREAGEDMRAAFTPAAADGAAAVQYVPQHASELAFRRIGSG